MTKKYFKWELRQILPALIVAFVIMGAVFLISCSFSTNYLKEVIDSSTGAISIVSRPSSYLSYILFPAFILATILPLNAFTYRYKKDRADCFLQVPLKNNSIRLVNLVTLLGGFLVAFSIIYWLGVMILGIRNGNALPTDNFYHYVYQSLNFVYYLPAYFLLLILLSASFAVSSFFVSLGHNLKDSILDLFFGEAVFACLIPSIFFYVFVYLLKGGTSWGNGNYNWLYYLMNPMISGLSSTGPIGFINGIFGTLIEYGNMNGVSDWTFIILEIINTFVFVLAGIGASLYLVYSKEPSGELAGTHGWSNMFTHLLPHFFFIITAFFLAFLSGVITVGSSSATAGGVAFVTILPSAIINYVAYYGILCIYRKSWKLKKFDLIFLLSNVAFFLVIIFCSSFIVFPSTVIY